MNIWRSRLRVLLPGLLFITMTSLSCSRDGQGGGSDPLSTGVMTNPASAEPGSMPVKGLPVLSVDNPEHDFGRVIEGEVISYAFRFVNTGDGDLVIAEVTSSCGCTVADYPEDPVKPGEAGFVKVTFDSKARRGFQRKSVNIVANTTPGVTTLIVKAQVIRPEE